MKRASSLLLGTLDSWDPSFSELEGSVEVTNLRLAHITSSIHFYLSQFNLLYLNLALPKIMKFNPPYLNVSQIKLNRRNPTQSNPMNQTPVSSP